MSRGSGTVRRSHRRQRRSEDGELAAPSGVVAIVGRPNVGKSTLFNRLVGGRRAIVDPMAGLTRDRLYGVTDWNGRRFTVIDTAGLDPELEDEDPGIRELVRGTQEQARIAIAEADLCIFMVDVREGVTGMDQDVANILRAGGKPVILAGNKADGGAEHYAAELYRLGLGDPLLISAYQGRDTGDLLDRVVEELPPPREDSGEDEIDELSLAIIGRPNVGKSSLLNAILGEQRALVSSVAGTTRDAVDTVMTVDGKQVRIVDTAGIRRRGVVKTDVEHYSLLRALKAMERCEVAIMVVDANDGVVAQDRHIAGYASDAGKGLVIVANKWDLPGQELRADPAFLKAFQKAFDFVPGCPVLTVSATEGRNVQKIVATAAQVASQRHMHIPTPVLNTLIRNALEEHPPRHHKGRRLKILYATQASAAQPTIVLFVNDPELMHFAYARYLENRIRAVFGYAGVRLRLVVRKRDES